MKVTAIILAGGKGTRVGATIPKQFIEVAQKPILVYTLDAFERHPLINQIQVVCIDGWEETVLSYAEKFSISKLTGVVSGGESALESIRKGIDALTCDDDDIVVIHEGVRPLVDEECISNVIRDSESFGAAISTVPLTDHVVQLKEPGDKISYIPRENTFRTATPQAFVYRTLMSAFEESDRTGIGKNSSFVGTSLIDLGRKIALSKGSEKNIKITDPADIWFFSHNLDPHNI